MMVIQLWEGMEMSQSTKEATLFQLKATDKGQILVLLDGRRLLINPSCITIVICWYPSAAIEISDGKGIFSVNVRNTMKDQVVQARWI